MSNEIIVKTESPIGEEPEAKPCDHPVGVSFAYEEILRTSTFPDWAEFGISYRPFFFCPDCGTKLSTELAQERSVDGLGDVLIEKQGQNIGNGSEGLQS